MAESSTSERRAAKRGDRRKHSRSGRRSQDPRARWRRLAQWAFAAYAVYLSIRSLPATIGRLWRRESV